MFLFSWIPACPSAWSSFQGGDLAFCILAGALEASQIYNTEREYEHTQRPHQKTATSHDELGILASSHLQVGWFNVPPLQDKNKHQNEAADGVMFI